MSENTRGRAGCNLSASETPELLESIVTQNSDSSTRAVLLDFGQTCIEAAQAENPEVFDLARVVLPIAAGELLRLLK